MSRLRKQILTKLHNELAETYTNWQRTKPGSLRRYILLHGTTHMLLIEKHQEARNILCDFAFCAEVVKTYPQRCAQNLSASMYLLSPFCTDLSFRRWSSFFRITLSSVTNHAQQLEKEWPVERILVQHALELSQNHPVAISAEKYLHSAKESFIWIRRKYRRQTDRTSPCVQMWSVESHVGKSFLEGRAVITGLWMWIHTHDNLEQWHLFLGLVKTIDHLHDPIERIAKESDTHISVHTRSGKSLYFHAHARGVTPITDAIPPQKKHFAIDVPLKKHPEPVQSTLEWSPSAAFELYDGLLCFGEDGEVVWKKEGSCLELPNMGSNLDAPIAQLYTPESGYLLADGRFISTHSYVIPRSFFIWKYIPNDDIGTWIIEGCHHHQNDDSDGFVLLHSGNILSVVENMGIEPYGSDCLLISNGTSYPLFHDRNDTYNESYIKDVRSQTSIHLINDDFFLTIGEQFVRVWDIKEIIAQDEQASEAHRIELRHEIQQTEILQTSKKASTEEWRNQFHKQRLGHTYTRKNATCSDEERIGIIRGEHCVVHSAHQSIVFSTSSGTLIEHNLHDVLYSQEEWERKTKALPGDNNRPCTLYPKTRLHLPLCDSIDRWTQQPKPSIHIHVKQVPNGLRCTFEEGLQPIYWTSKENWNIHHVLEDGTILIGKNRTMEILQIYKGTTPIGIDILLESASNVTEKKHPNEVEPNLSAAHLGIMKWDRFLKTKCALLICDTLLGSPTKIKLQPSQRFFDEENGWSLESIEDSFQGISASPDYQIKMVRTACTYILNPSSCPPEIEYLVNKTDTERMNLVAQLMDTIDIHPDLMIVLMFKLFDANAALDSQHSILNDIASNLGISTKELPRTIRKARRGMHKQRILAQLGLTEEDMIRVDQQVRRAKRKIGLIEDRWNMNEDNLRVAQKYLGKARAAGMRLYIQFKNTNEDIYFEHLGTVDVIGIRSYLAIQGLTEMTICDEWVRLNLSRTCASIFEDLQRFQCFIDDMATMWLLNHRALPRDLAQFDVQNMLARLLPQEMEQITDQEYYWKLCLNVCKRMSKVIFKHQSKLKQAQKEYRHMIQSLALLPTREATLMRYNYNFPKQILEDIGHDFAVTRERVQQIKDSFIKKLNKTDSDRKS